MPVLIDSCFSEKACIAEIIVLLLCNGVYVKVNY